MEYVKKSFAMRILHSIKVYAFYLKLYFKRLGVYRGDTAITLITGLLTQAGSLIFIELIFRVVPSIAGWSKYQLLFLYGFIILGRSLSEVFLNVPHHISGLVRKGEMDVLMIRPKGVLFQAIGISQEINGMGSAMTALTVLLYASFKLNFVWTRATIPFFIIALICNTLIYYNIIMLLAVSAFWFVEVRNIMTPIAWLYEFTRYPITVFHPIIRAIISFVVPYTLGTYYPVSLLLQTVKCSWVLWVLPLFTVCFCIAIYRFWLFALNHYTSANG